METTFAPHVASLVKSHLVEIQRKLTNVIERDPANNPGVIRSFYICHCTKSNLGSVEDFIMPTLFQSPPLDNLQKHTLDSNSLCRDYPSQWPKKINEVISQAISANVPYILHIPRIEELCEMLRNRHMTEAVCLPQQLERLRGTNVILLGTGIWAGDCLQWNNPFKSLFASEDKSYEIGDTSEEDRQVFYESLFLENCTNFNQSERKVAGEILRNIMDATQEQDLGPMVALHDNLHHVFLTLGADNADNYTILKALQNTVSAFKMGMNSTSTSIVDEDMDGIESID